jgi:hypothetical protein
MAGFCGDDLDGFRSDDGPLHELFLFFRPGRRGFPGGVNDHPSFHGRLLLSLLIFFGAPIGMSSKKAINKKSPSSTMA